MQRLLSATFTLLVLLTNNAWAQEGVQSPIIKQRIDASMSGGFTLEKDPKALGLNHRMDYTLIWRLPGKTTFLTKVGIDFGSTKFKPSLRFAFGPGWKLSKRWGIGYSFLYKNSPGWGADKMSHVLATSINPFCAISEKISFALGIGVGRKFFNDGSGGLSMTFSPQLSYSFN